MNVGLDKPAAVKASFSWALEGLNLTKARGCLENHSRSSRQGWDTLSMQRFLISKDNGQSNEKPTTGKKIRKEQGRWGNGRDAVHMNCWMDQDRRTTVQTGIVRAYQRTGIGIPAAKRRGPTRKANTT